VKVVGRDLLDAFCAQHADARAWIEAWLNEAEEMSWESPQDIKQRYATASFLAGNVVIFNVRGNRYRLEIKMSYRNGVAIICWAGTHREYDVRNRRRQR